ncbi:hypothetical protein Thermus77412_24600 [Thermus antranikianii]
MLFQEGRRVLRLQYQGQEPFSLDLLKGAERLRILTYSASEALVRELALEGEVEVVMGAFRPAASLSDLGTLQGLLIEELRGELQAPERLAPVLERMRQGKLRILLSRYRSHAKLFLVEKGGRRYALFGSANLSQQALARPFEKGGQLELLALVEDEEGFRQLEALYNALREESDPLRPEHLERKRLEPEDLPLLQEAMRRSVVLEVPKEVPKAYLVELAPTRMSQPLRALEEHVRIKGGFLRIGPEHVKLVRAMRKEEAEEDPLPLLSPTEEGLRLGEEIQPYLEPKDPGVAEDARTMTAFLEGYLSGDFLHEEEAREQVRDYFVLWCWFWAAPQMGYLLKRAHLEGYPPHAYPLYALVYGKANTGKSTFLRLLSRSVTGAEVRMFPGAELSQELLRRIHRSEVGLVAVVDDVSAEDVGRKVERVLKGLYDVPLPYNPTPVALSLNSSQSYAPPDEVKKRALLVKAMATLDTTRPDIMHRAYTRAQNLYLALGNRLYRAYLPLLLEKLKDEVDWLKASSEALVEVLGKALGEVPPWASPLDYSDLSREYLERVRSKVEEMLRQHGNARQVQGDLLILPLGKDAKRYAKELPGWLAVEARGDLLILSRKGLRKLGLERGTGPWEWLARLWRS